MHLFRRKGLSVATNIAQSIDEHAAITRAVAAADSENARLAALAHITGGFARYMTMAEANSSMAG